MRVLIAVLTAAATLGMNAAEASARPNAATIPVSVEGHAAKDQGYSPDWCTNGLPRPNGNWDPC
jgi:hypothetical protein